MTVKYNKTALSDYLRGCVDITDLVLKEEGSFFKGDSIISAHIDLRHHGFDIVIIGLRIDYPSLDVNETLGEIKYIYRTIQCSEGEQGFSPTHVLENSINETLHFSDITGDRIRYAKYMNVSDPVTHVPYIVQMTCEIFFTGGLCNTVDYWYNWTPSTIAPKETPADGRFRFHGLYGQEPRNGNWQGPSRSDLFHHHLDHREILDEIVRHEKLEKRRV